MKYLKSIGTAVGLLLSGAGVPYHASADTRPGTVTERVKIGTNRVEINGCHDISRSFTTHVADVNRLDRSFKGALDGIEIQTVTGHGQISNVTWTADGNNVTYQLSAKGAGVWVPPPTVPLLGKVGGGACIGAKGQWLQVNVFGVYTKTTR